MAQIRIKRTTNTITKPTLLPGELGISGSELYYGQANLNDNVAVEATLVAKQNGPNTFTGNNNFNGTNTFYGANSFNQLPTVNGKTIALSTDVPKIKSITIKYGTNSSSNGNLVDAYSGQSAEEIELDVYAKGETYSRTEVDNAINSKVAGAVQYLGTVSAVSGLSTSAGKGDFYRVSTQFTFWSEVAHVGDMLIATKDNPAQNSTDWDLAHLEIDTDTWTANSKSAAGYVAAGGSNKGTMWITDNDGNPGWSNIFQNSNRPVIGGQTTYTGTAAQLAMRGEVGIIDVDIEANVGDAVVGGYSLTLDNGESWTVGTSGVQTLKVTNENDVVTAYLPETTKIYDGSKYVNLSDFGGAIKSITLNGVAATISGSTAALTYDVPEATSSVFGGIKLGYTESSNNFAVKLDSGKAYITIDTIDCGQWS